MRRTPVRNDLRWSLSAGLLAGVLLASPALAQSQSPSTSQDQPAVQQNPTTAPKKVYTNEDLKRMDPGDVSVVGNSRATAKPGTTTAANGQAKNEQYWRNRAQKLRAEMAEVDRQIAEMTAADQAKGAGTGSSNGSTAPPLSAYHTASRANTQLQRLQSRKAQLQRQMDQLEDEAQRAGVPPGWLR